MSCAQNLSNDALIENLGRIKVEERQRLAYFLEYVVEVDRRRLWAEHACDSMHKYLTERLGYSDPTASKRVKVARAGEEFPFLLEVIREGRLHLTGAYLLSKHLTDENHRKLLSWACGKSKLAIERKIAEMCPLPKIQPTLRKLPERKAKEAAAIDRPPQERTGTRPPPPRVKTSSLKPSGPRRSRFTMDISDEEAAILNELRDITGIQDEREILLRAARELLEREKKRKFGAAIKPRKVSPEKQSTTSRYIPNSIKRAVIERDGQQCNVPGPRRPAMLGDIPARVLSHRAVGQGQWH